MTQSNILSIAGLFLVFAIFTACEKDDKTVVPDGALYSGNFVNAVHPTSGVASIDKDATKLTLTNFKSDAGPDLNIYLASTINNITADYIDLGDIKGVDGNYTYDLPTNTDYTIMKYVVVWCVAFDVNFGYAELAP
jgi:hypothetical protein